ncbi:GNAT family N-acetyltransferase [Candidatus Laterigemmans baculatus]|uniref:GNAT family N-acetyltransferase n=1 Tax=Candidatus Laterigemmans baculatus TaxID=2770505 RepID=UPI00193B5F5A|nr:N-acetyltransferase [Candidatus Laterigemmans baculatus]
MSLVIRPEAERDRQAVRGVNRAAFGTTAEADLVDALREGGQVAVSLVAESNGRLVGHILFSGLLIVADPATVDAVSLAPMAVLPSHQRQGIGCQLVEAGLRACRERGDRIVLVLGHPEFYRRFGFSAPLAEPLASPFGGGEAWMALELEPGALHGIAGRVEYPPPFAALG